MMLSTASRWQPSLLKSLILWPRSCLEGAMLLLDAEEGLMLTGLLRH